ncbi:hypothetical protein [Oceanisphaera sp. IT1-181]|nr:hypothetical protein [Oceanisphaera sp. IT1-181]
MVDKHARSGYCYAIRYSRLFVMLLSAHRITSIIIIGTITSTTIRGTGAG